VPWAPGKGVIGASVAHGETVAVDLAQLYRDLGSPAADEWSQVPADVRLGLSYGEYLDVRDKYFVVVSTPVIDDLGGRTKVWGCVALDGPDGELDALSTGQIVGVVNSLAQGLLRQNG
jgi:hypothetical protein